MKNKNKNVFSLVMLLSVHEFIPYFAVETGSQYYLKNFL